MNLPRVPQVVRGLEPRPVSPSEAILVPRGFLTII